MMAARTPPCSVAGSPPVDTTVRARPCQQNQGARGCTSHGARNQRHVSSHPRQTVLNATPFGHETRNHEEDMLIFFGAQD
jgi:hypothetical protein